MRAKLKTYSLIIIISIALLIVALTTTIALAYFNDTKKGDSAGIVVSTFGTTTATISNNSYFYPGGTTDLVVTITNNTGCAINISDLTITPSHIIYSSGNVTYDKSTMDIITLGESCTGWTYSDSKFYYGSSTSSLTSLASGASVNLTIDLTIKDAPTDYPSIQHTTSNYILNTCTGMIFSVNYTATEA